jgi:hypothetical protein
MLGGPPVAAETESTCVSCHEEEEADVPDVVSMGKDDLRLSFQVSLPVREWRASVHATHDVSCDACHGGDPHAQDADESMSEDAGFLENPSWNEMSAFCGTCHEEIAVSFDGGVFGAGMDQGLRVPTCETCHMPLGHRILEARPVEVLTAERCPDCVAVEDAQGVLAILKEVRARDGAVSARLRAVQARGIELADVEEQLARSRRDFARSVHGFDRAAIARASASALAEADAVDALLGPWEREGERRRAFGVALLGGLTLVLVALLAYQRALRPERASGRADGSRAGEGR